MSTNTKTGRVYGLVADGYLPNGTPRPRVRVAVIAQTDCGRWLRVRNVRTGDEFSCPAHSMEVLP